MLRSIYEEILAVFGTHHRRQASRCVASRRLTLESLESRQLMAAASLTMNSISDGSFEAPSMAASAYQIAPASSPWQFSGSAGVSGNASGFTKGSPTAPDGVQVGFIKDNANISQTVYLAAGVYNLSLQAAQRVNYQTQNQELEVLVDGTEVGEVLPAGTAYLPYQTWNFTVTSGTHTVEILGTAPPAADSTAFIDQVAIAPVVDTVLDAGFEQPAVADNSSQTNPSGLPWQFSGTAGVASNGSTFVADPNGNQDAPEGTQVAYIQDTGSLSQTVYLDAGTYQVSFLAAQRAINQANYQEIEVLVDGVSYGAIQPTETTYDSYQSSAFTVTAGSHTIEFLGLNPELGDNTAFLDEVAVSAANPIINGSFETPILDPGQFQVAPGGSSWQFTGSAGFSSNGSTVTSGNANAPDGVQVAYIEGKGGMGQSLNLQAGSYDLTFQAAQCVNAATQNQQIQVLVDGTQVGLITPDSTAYGLYETANFTVTAGMHTIQFVGTNPQGSDDVALLDVVSLVPSQDQIRDGGFETPVLAAKAYATAPSGTPWQFTGLAGVTGNDSIITSGNPNAPQGTQVAFLMNNCSMSYSVYLDADTYNLSFLAAQRAVNQSQSQQISVLVDGAQVALVTPAGTSYNLYETSNFTVASGVHTIQFACPSPFRTGSTALVDQVALGTAEDAFADSGFEMPVLAAHSYAVAPGGSGWQFSGLAGLSTNGSAFTNGSSAAPDGAQVAFLKNNGSISQSVWFDGGSYNISFLAAQRASFQTQSQQIRVLVDGALVTSITPSSTRYILYQTGNFTVATGMHSVEFLGGVASGDSTAFIDDAAISTGSGIADGSFEEAALAATAYQVAPGNTPWQFAGLAGVSTNNSGFTAGNPNAPAGAQVAFLKDAGSMSQSVDMAAGFYNISFLAAQRDKFQTQYQAIEILVDGVEVGSAIPASTTYGLYETSNFTVTAGVHVIRFVGLNPTGGSDNTAFIDDVQLNA